MDRGEIRKKCETAVVRTAMVSVSQSLLFDIYSKVIFASMYPSTVLVVAVLFHAVKHYDLDVRSLRYKSTSLFPSYCQTILTLVAEM